MHTHIYKAISDLKEKEESIDVEVSGQVSDDNAERTTFEHIYKCLLSVFKTHVRKDLYEHCLIHSGGNPIQYKLGTIFDNEKPSNSSNSLDQNMQFSCTECDFTANENVALEHHTLMVHKDKFPKIDPRRPSDPTGPSLGILYACHKL